MSFVLPNLVLARLEFTYTKSIESVYLSFARVSDTKAVFLEVKPGKLKLSLLPLKNPTKKSKKDYRIAIH